MNFETAFLKYPLIAILRGITPDRVLPIVELLIEEHFTLIEVPLNSTKALESIRLAVSTFGTKVIFGAGTVLDSKQVQSVLNVGGRLIIAPNLNLSVAEAALKHNLVYCPGVGTATEAFQALALGAHMLKLFPAEMILPPAVKALRTVLPKSALLVPVGGIDPDSMKAYINAGANGFGIGSSLYHPSFTLKEIRSRAFLFRESLNFIREEQTV